MPESSKLGPETGYMIQTMTKNHEKTMGVLENRQKNSMEAFGYHLAPKSNPKQC